MSESTPRPTLTSTRFIADTNVAIDFINNPAWARARLVPGTTIFVPTVVLGELFFGARNSKRIEQNLASVEQFAASAKVLVIDLGIARWYGELRQQLQVKGRPIPDNDLWIAATAVTHGLPVATRDSHFQEVAGLLLIPW